MKAFVVVLIIGAFIIQADALKCRQSSCTGSGSCLSRTQTCSDAANRCFVMLKSSPIFMFTRGCATEANCQTMRIFEPSTRCCSSDLCN